MKLVSITYVSNPDFQQPAEWLHRIRPSTGILEALSSWYDVHSIDRIGYHGEFTQNGVQYHFPDLGSNQLSVPWKLNRYASSLQPDIVLVQGMIFPLQVIQLRMQLGRQVKIIVQNHAEKPGRRRLQLLQTLADPLIDAYLFTSRRMGEAWIRKGIIRRPEKIREVMEASSVFSPADRATARTQTNAAGSPVFLWVGRLDENKDPLTVVRAFLSFAAVHPAARLYMIFHTKELLPAVEKLLDPEPGGRQCVILVGEQRHTEMEAWYNSADYIVSESHYEGSGIAVAEAMSCGCIPVLTDILSFRMMTAGGHCGVLYPAGDEQSLLAALHRVTGLDRDAEREKTLCQFRAALSFEAIATTIHEIAASLTK